MTEAPDEEMFESPLLQTPGEEMAEGEPGARPEDRDPTERANLAAHLTEEEWKALGNRCVMRYERDLSSRADRMKKLELLQIMYALVAEQKNFPFHKAANVKTPSLTGPNLQIQARLYDMIWPPSGKVFTVVPATMQDQHFAHLTEQFANSYVRYRMPYMAQGLDDTLHQMCLYGSAFRRTYWDAYEKKVRSDWIPIEDFVVAYSQRSQDPSMSDVPRYTMLHRMSMYDIEAYGRDGIFVNTEAARGRKDESGSTFAETAKKIDGVYPDEDDDDLPRQVLEQHCKWRTPDDPGRHPSFDGREHYVVITVDAVSGVVLRLSLREENDPDDQRRFDREKQALEMKRQQMMAAMAAQTMAGPPQPGAMGMTGPPQPGAMDATAPGAGAPPSPASLAPLMQAAPALPEPAPVRQRQICFFTHYRCFPSDGFYGLGYGDLLYGIALAENTVINQWIDGMTLKNAKPMFMSRQARMQRGAINIQPGEAVEIDVPSGQIKDAVLFLDPPQSDPGTVPLIKMLDGMKDTIAGNGDLMSGQAPGSNQTKAGMQILTEQMMTPITVLARRVKEAFRHELDKIWRCWGVFLEDEDVADVIGDAGQPQQIPIGKAMFTPTVHLVPASDPRMKSQRMDDLQQLTQFAMSLPVIAQNPQVGGPIMLKIAEMVFRCLPDGEALIPMLSPPPPPPPPPASPLEENVGFLQGKDHPVTPVDDDEEHISHHQAFLGSADASALDEKGHLMIVNHLRGHIAQRLQKRGQQLGQGQQPNQLPGAMGGRGGPLALPPPDGAPGSPPPS